MEPRGRGGCKRADAGPPLGSAPVQHRKPDQRALHHRHRRGARGGAQRQIGVDEHAAAPVPAGASPSSAPAAASGRGAARRPAAASGRCPRTGPPGAEAAACSARKWRIAPMQSVDRVHPLAVEPLHQRADLAPRAPRPRRAGRRPPRPRSWRAHRRRHRRASAAWRRRTCRARSSRPSGGNRRGRARAPAPGDRSSPRGRCPFRPALASVASISSRLGGSS